MDIKSEIIQKEEELRQAMLSNDIQKLDELIDKSLVFVAPNGLIATKQMDLETHKNKLQKISKLTPSEQQIIIHDNSIVVSVVMEIVGSFAQTDISGNYRYLRIWNKINNNWKIVAGSVTKIQENR